MTAVYLSFYPCETAKGTPEEEHRIGRRLLARALLEQYHLTDFTCGTIPDDRIRTGQWGKPSLSSFPGIHFNITHCRGLVACAVSDKPIGIDAENIRPFRDHLLPRVLTEEEQAQLALLGTTDRKRMEWFFRFWTLKESRMKHSGTGMSVPFTSFSFHFEQEGTDFSITCSEPGLSFRQFSLKGMLPDTDYLLSICRPQTDAQQEIIFREFRESPPDTFSLL